MVTKWNGNGCSWWIQKGSEREKTIRFVVEVLFRWALEGLKFKSMLALVRWSLHFNPAATQISLAQLLSYLWHYFECIHSRTPFIYIYICIYTTLLYTKTLARHTCSCVYYCSLDQKNAVRICVCVCVWNDREHAQPVDRLSLNATETNKHTIFQFQISRLGESSFL